MRNIIALCTAMLVFASPAAVQAATFSPNGTYEFIGSVEVRKNLPSWITCELTLTITVSGGVATTSANFSGAAPCSFFTFSASPFATDGFGTPVSVLEIAGAVVNMAFPTDTCSGNLLVLWGGNGPPNPRTIEFLNVLSDIQDSSLPGVDPNCKMRGIVTQTSPATQLDIS